MNFRELVILSHHLIMTPTSGFYMPITLVVSNPNVYKYKYTTTSIFAVTTSCIQSLLYDHDDLAFSKKMNPLLLLVII